MKIKGFVFLFCTSAAFLGCIKQTPQLPSNKIVATNSETQSLLSINQRLAIKEDSLLQKFAENTKRSFIKNELGFWYKLEYSGTGKKIQDKSNCQYKYTLKLLNGKVMKVGSEQITLGKKQINVGLEEGLKLMRVGDSATFIIPWYLAYGMKGNEPYVPAYSSIIYELKVLN